MLREKVKMLYLNTRKADCCEMWLLSLFFIDLKNWNENFSRESEIGKKTKTMYIRLRIFTCLWAKIFILEQISHLDY